MSQIYNNNSTRPKPQENQLESLEISSREFMHFAGNSAEGLGSKREDCWGYVSIFENTLRKVPHLSLKVAATLLSGSGKNAVGTKYSHS